LTCCSVMATSSVAWAHVAQGTPSWGGVSMSWDAEGGGVCVMQAERTSSTKTVPHIKATRKWRHRAFTLICNPVHYRILLTFHWFQSFPSRFHLSDLPGVRRGNVVAFSTMRDGEEQLVVAAEGNSGDAEDIRRVIRARILETFALQVSHVAVVAVGTLPKTSSGKAQRNKTRWLFEDGALPEHGTAAARGAETGGDE